MLRRVMQKLPAAAKLERRPRWRLPDIVQRPVSSRARGAGSGGAGPGQGAGQDEAGGWGAVGGGGGCIASVLWTGCSLHSEPGSGAGGQSVPVEGTHRVGLLRLGTAVVLRLRLVKVGLVDMRQVDEVLKVLEAVAALWPVEVELRTAGPE